MITAADLNARYVKATVRHSVTVFQPLADGTHQPVCGQILGEMHCRGELHHYRVSIRDGTVLFVPPAWLHPDSRVAVMRAGLTLPDPPADGLPAQFAPSNSKQGEKQHPSCATASRLTG